MLGLGGPRKVQERDEELLQGCLWSGGGVRYHFVRLRPSPIAFLRELSRLRHSRRSFESLTSWLSDARALASPDLEVVVVGNKLDQEDDRQVPYLEASRWAQEHGESSVRAFEGGEGES